MASHRRAGDVEDHLHERQSNGNGGVRRLWSALGLSIGALLIMLGIIMKQHSDIERTQSEGAVRDAELRHDISASKDRIDAVERVLNERGVTIEMMRREIEHLSTRQDQVFDTLYGGKKR